MNRWDVSQVERWAVATDPEIPPRTVRDLHRNEVIAQWLEAADAAISALRGFRGFLEAWQNSPTEPKALDVALALLDQAGLSEWAEWCPAAGGLDALAKALFPGK